MTAFAPSGCFRAGGGSLLGLILLFELAKQAGVEFSACIACAVNMGLKERLEAEGVEVIRWGQKLSELLQNKKAVLSV